MPHPEKLTAGWVESWEKFLAQNLPFKIFLKGRDLTYLACNENYAADHGIKPSEIFGRSDYDLYPKELAEKYRADDLRILETGRSETIEESYVKDGQEFHVQTIKSLFRDQSDEVIGILGTFWDVSERKRVEEALRESKERLELALIGGNLGFYDWDLQTGRVYTDERYLGMLGYAPGEIDLGCRENWEQHVHPDDLGFANYPLQSDLRGETVSYDEEYRMRHKSGEWVWVRDRAQITARGADGRPLRVTGLHEDITERKRAEEALKQGNERLLLATVAGGVGIWDLDVVNNKLTWDDQMFRLYGVAPDNFGGAYETWKERVHPEDVERGDAEVQMALRGEKEFDTEFRVVWPNGTIHHIRARARVHRDAAGQPTKLIGTNYDITERKQSEEALRTAEANYRNLFERVPSGLYRSTLEGRFLEVNPALADLFGYSSVQELMTLDIGSAFYHSAEERRQWVEKLLQAGELRNTEFQALRKNGSSMVLLEHSRVVRDESGKVLFFEGTLTDTTDRKRAEEALRESEEKYRKLIETMQDGVYRSSHEGKFLEVNPAMVKMLGYDSKEELLAIDIKSQLYCAPEDREIAVLEEKLEKMSVFRHRKKDGSEIWVEDHGRQVVDDEGTVLYNEGVLRDISERKRVEEALRESKERLELALIGGNLGFYDWDLQTGRVYTDERYLGMLGYAPGEIDLGCRENWEQHVHPDDLGFANYPLQSDLRGETVSYDEEYRMRHKSGEWVWVRDRAQITARGADGRPLRVTGLHENITERKRAERALAQSERRFRDMADHLPQFTYETNREGRFTYINLAGLQRTGYSAVEAEEGLSYLQLIHPDEQEKARCSFHELLVPEHSMQPYEYTLVGKTGFSFPVMIYSAPILEGGTVTGMRGFMIDISERKRAEQLQADMVRSVVHDLSSPITSIQAVLDNLATPVSQARQAEYLAIARRNADRLQQLTRNLLEAAQIEAGELQLRREPIDPAQMLRDLAEMIQPLMEEKRLSLRLLLPDESLLLEADRPRLEEVFSNLWANSLKFTPAGGSIETELRREGDWAIFSVQDSGPGISPLDLPRIFQRFFQGSGQRQGSGLGLFIAWWIVQAHGGRIQATSPTGQGARFTVHLPLASEYFLG
jgi:PAS domain S-box-containing protein